MSYTIENAAVTRGAVVAGWYSVWALVKSSLLAVLALTACASSSPKADADDLESLRKAVKAYNEAYRWKNFERAASFLPEDRRLSFVDEHQQDEKSLHIEGYQVLQVQMDSDVAARVQVRVTFMMLPSVVVQNRRLTQHWHRVNQRWMLEAEDNAIRPLRKEAQSPNDNYNPDAFGGGEPPSD